MTLKLLCLACCLACVVARAQLLPTPDQAVKVVSVTAGPDTVSTVSVRVHNQSAMDITHLSGLLTYTPYGLRPVQVRCSTSTLEHYAQLNHPVLRANIMKNAEKAKAEGKKVDLGTLNKNEDLTFDCGTRPTKIEAGTASFSPDTVIFADQTWSGDQPTAMNEFRLRKQKASEYGKLIAAVVDAEKAPDPLKRYQEIRQQLLPTTGIKQYADHTTFTQPKGGGDPTFVYNKLQNYIAEYEEYAREKAGLAAHPEVKITPSLEEQLRTQIDFLKRRDATVGAAYHQHSEAK